MSGGGRVTIAERRSRLGDDDLEMRVNGNDAFVLDILGGSSGIEKDRLYGRINVKRRRVPGLNEL
jgi:hypothetical protein